MFLVDHNVGLVAEACDRVAVLATGILIFDGSPSEALANPEVKSAYLGDATVGGVH
jgi:branched-chain amino acid transport system ATP-binding protein